MPIVELVSIVLALLLVAACGMFVAAEFSLITVNRNDVKAAIAAGDKRAVGVLKGMDTLSTQLSGAQLGITLTNLGIGFLAEPAVAAIVVGPLTGAGLAEAAARTLSVIISLVLATVVTMVFGELVPKNLAIAKPLATARQVVGFQRGFSAATKPLLVFFNGTANAILRLFNITPTEHLDSVRSPEELVALAQHSAHEGVLPEHTAQLLQRSVAFGHRRGHDAMTPRTRMVTVSGATSIQELLELSASTGHSRFPVAEGDVHSVDGVVHVRRALAVPYEQRATTAVATVAEEATLVPDTVELDELMDTLREGGLQMAVLIDETGDVAGLLTLEDLVEELVGEVVDEHDPEEAVASPVSDGVWQIDGALRPDEATEILRARIPDGADHETVAGLFTLELGRIAKEGDVVVLHTAGEYQLPASEVTLTVLEMDGARIARLEASVTELDEDEEEGK